MNQEIRILIADENAETRKNIRDVLDGSGRYAVTETDNGTTAYDKIKNGNFDIVICDAWLTGIDGVSLIRRVTIYCRGGRKLLLLELQYIRMHRVPSFHLSYRFRL